MLSDEILPYKLLEPRQKKIPVLISVPHCGTEFPTDIAQRLKPKFAGHPDDTDWFVDQLYSFAPDIGATMITARFSRYVVDLNRDPEGSLLYGDGRAETGVIPLQSFSGEALYSGAMPDEKEFDRRLGDYFWPYYKMVGSILSNLKKTFGHVVFFDAHSIRRHVPTIRKDPFPDLILGNQDGKTADQRLIDTAHAALSSDARFRLAHNDPFKGGYLTRYFGHPNEHVHALQLEMSQNIYMDEDACQYDAAKAEHIRAVLQKTILDLAETVETLT